MRTVYAQKNKKIILGRQGEDKAVRVVWPGIVSDWSSLYGGGSFQLSVRRFSDENAYPVSVEVNGDDISFTVTSAETAIAGNGKCELTYIANGTIAKSATWETVVLNSLTGQTPSEPPEEPAKSWFTAIQGQIGNLANLETASKDNLVAAINEAAQSGGGGSGGASVELDTTLTQSGKAADAKAVGDALDNVATAYVLTLSTNEADAQANSDAVTAAIAEHGHVMLKPGKYPFGSMVKIPDDTTLDLGQATIFQTTYKSTTPLFCLNGVNATLKNGFLRGTYDKNDGDDGYEYFEGEVLVRVDACENGLIENVDAGFAWGVSLAFGSLAQERGYVGSAANTSGAEHTSAALPIVEGYSYVMAYGQVGYNYIFSIAPVEYVFYDADGVALKTVTEIPRIPVGIPSGASTFTIKTICPEFLAYYYGFTNVMPMLTVRDCYFHNNHSGGFCNSTHIITVENTKFAFMGTVDNTGTKSTRSTIYGIDIEDYPTPFMRLSNCSFIKCPKSVMDGSTISQVDNCYGYDCDFGVYRGWYHIYNNLTANEFYVQGHTNEWQYPRVYLNGGKINGAPVLQDNSGEYLFMNASEATLVGANQNYEGGEFAPFTTYVKLNYKPDVFSFKSVLRNVTLIDYSLASVGETRASMFPKKGSEHCVWKTPYLYEKTYKDPQFATYDIYGLTTDLPIYPAGFTFYDCVFKCRFTGFVQNNGMPDTAFVGTYENCIIDCDGGGGSLFSYGNLSGARNVNLTFKNCVINNSSVPLLFGANTYRQSFAEGSKITFNNCTVLNTEANGIIGNADLTNLTVAYTSGGEGGVDIDASLTVEGAAADAKAVGIALNGKQDSGNYVKSVNGNAPDENGNVEVEGSGGGGDSWELIYYGEITEDIGSVIVDKDSNGNAFSLKEYKLVITTVAAAENPNSGFSWYTHNDDGGTKGPFYTISGAVGGRTLVFDGKLCGNCWWCQYITDNGNTVAQVSRSVLCPDGQDRGPSAVPVYKLKLAANSGNTCGAGSKVALFGVRA